MKLPELVQQIVKDAEALKDEYTDAKNAPVNYACVFCQTEEEFGNMAQAANELGPVLEETPSGPLYQLRPISTGAGKVRLVKIRKPDPNRPERGDADFTVANYPSFKKRYLNQPGFKLIQRPAFEMIELKQSEHPVLAYFSHPPLEQQYGLLKV